MTTQSKKGQPLVVLFALLGGWIGLRAVFWDAPGFSENPSLSSQDVSRFAQAKVMEGSGERSEMVAEGTDQADASEPTSKGNDGPPVDATHRTGSSFARSSDPGWIPAPYAGPARPLPHALPPVPSQLSARVAANHQMLWMAALSRLPLAMNVLETVPDEVVRGPFYLAEAKPSGPKRWSADSWMLLRQSIGGAPVGARSPGTYGDNQAGAVLRYRLAPQSPHRPIAYVRATTALNGAKDKELAAGLSIKPLPRLPIVAAAEVRASDHGGGSELRPAIMAVTEVAPVDLSAGARAEFYAQAGYVGGRFKTGFVDGQLRIARQLVALGKSDVRVGGGSWGGAQRGASRVDIGPTVTVGFPIGSDALARVAVDWRFRVEGTAKPNSGPAVTLSAGF